ncbi:peptidase S9 [Blastococcus saxobsidens]|uniref:Peptidase S9 n=1 Tax=Blastococcus saxobsidens TaxID=138336 RepID=A0A6L9W4Y6_9ACTN|nr:peptidase S9 [Blastococcus saxobsidens]NEK86852.1 peptidase S9 [Blastococcus saxobsidens]
MVRKSPPSRAVAAMGSAAATALYYAMPDLVPSRRARGWTKAGLTAASLAVALPELRSAWATAREGLAVEGTPPPSEVFRSLPTRSKAVGLGLATAASAGFVGFVVAAERRAFRHGQARAASGKRLPHTGPALVYGALAGALWYLPDPPEPN